MRNQEGHGGSVSLFFNLAPGPPSKQEKPGPRGARRSQEEPGGTLEKIRRSR